MNQWGDVRESASLPSVCDFFCLSLCLSLGPFLLLLLWLEFENLRFGLQHRKRTDDQSAPTAAAKSFRAFGLYLGTASWP